METLKNCPNCGGFLDDFGRCEFCGSKVYDLSNIDVSNRVGRGKTYIRIRTDNQVILAPVMTTRINITCQQDCFPIMDVEFLVCGNTIIQEVEDENT